MAQIPFPPGGPQVQAALQNPARFPDQRLQQYAQGQQPTGQVPPPMAANELTIRNAQRQAASRQSAMQNNPQNSPTVFQQKDMELQQKAQQLAAMQQQMQQQMQQKEQQLGVAGALMAKKAQDLQAREQGIAALSLPQNMFTAMNGGVVFNRGGGVQGYASRGLVMPDLGVFNEDRPSFSVPASAPRKSKDDLEEEDMLARLLSPAEQLAAFSKISTLTKEERDRKKEERIKELEEQYKRYKEGIGGLDTETAEAMKGSAPTFQERLGRGLARLPADLRGVRLGGALAAIAGGAAEVDASYEARKREAAKYLADAKRKEAAADLAEQRNQDTLARQLRAAEQSDRLKADELLGRDVVSELEMLKGVAGLEESQRSRQESKKAAEDRMAFEKQKFASEEAYRAGDRAFREKMVRLEAALRPEDFSNRLFRMATNPNDPNQEFARNLLESRGGRGGAGTDGRPTYEKYVEMVENRLLTDKGELTKVLKAELKRDPTKAELRAAAAKEVKDELETEFGPGLFKGQGGKGATPSAKIPPAVGTVMEGYKFKGGDPSDKNNWEKVKGA